MGVFCDIMKNLYWGSPQLPPQQGGVHHGHCDQDEVELAQRDLDIVCQREWAWWPSWCCFAIDFQNCWWPESHEHIGKLMDILAGDSNEQQDGLSAIRGLLLKIYCNFSSTQYKNLRAFFNQNANILGVDNNFFPSYNRVVKEQKMACPSNTPFEGWYCSPRAWGMSGAATEYSRHLQEEEPSQSLLQNDRLGCW